MSFRDFVGAVGNNDGVTDTADARKVRGAFFTPDAITAYLAQWAVRSADDRIFEPSAGDAAFLVAVTHRLRELGAPEPEVDGVEIHPASAATARRRVTEAGGRARIRTADFFGVDPRPEYAAVIGNPPYIRYQDFRGQARAQSRRAALKAGVTLSGLASSWAAFTVHAALFLRPGGRMALVLPAELLSVNYAAAVRKFLFDRFASVELVMFDEQVFPEAEADVVLLLADGFDGGPSGHAVIHRARNAESLTSELVQRNWSPRDPADKWISGLVGNGPVDALHALHTAGDFTLLEHWADTTLGMVTGNNGYFALSPARVRELGLRPADVLPLSPPGSAHLRGLTLSADQLARLGEDGKSIHLFRPTGALSAAAKRYVEAGRAAGVHLAYKCRVREPWYLVPLVEPADLLLTCMNADTPRLVTNRAKAHHLNSVHGVYLRDGLSGLGRDLLPLAALNSATLLHAEMVGRSYGGGILKIEPREADRWLVPAPRLIAERSSQLRDVRRRIAALLSRGELLGAVRIVDDALGLDSRVPLESVRSAHDSLATRRAVRSRRAR
ncbi:N-6 DNA methylase [Mycolicibacterium wolinskyi]|uniref:Methyltransferase n=1 Tax=Mycolicibacterium wolinskyi TaxID=59750 RepID=A0A1X2F5R6_9MYCO|nr:MULTISPECIES: N-6 DNA methylase [Mycolicibacterium]MCV7284242.1 N-6 DNA methylase [Mycolicibacterium wolinskyi]MCV7294078.1 N-6 DNA methylase [Mycolicibacterium goodii]ORX13782.1 methyltransferase [Mycolicibacterium wolinskyi]